MDSPYLSLSLYTTHTLPVPHDGPRSLVEVTRLTLHLVPPLDVSAPTAHTPHATVRDGDPARVFRCHVPTLVLYSRVYPVACHVCHEWRCVWLSLSFFNVTEAFSEAVTEYPVPDTCVRPLVGKVCEALRPSGWISMTDVASFKHLDFVAVLRVARVRGGVVVREDGGRYV